MNDMPPANDNDIDSVEKRFRQWWRALQPRQANSDRASMGPFADQLGRADRAKLRRRRNIAGLLMEQPTVLLDQHLRQACFRLVGIQIARTHAMGDERIVHRMHEAIAMAAGVLAHIKEDTGSGAPDQSLAARLGQKIGDRRRMSELRFRNLQSAQNLDDLLLMATRALALAGGCADVGKLGKDLIRWADELERPPIRPASSVRYQWAREYYLANDKSIVPEDDSASATEQPSA